jgi:hypothetical protein
VFGVPGVGDWDGDRAADAEDFWKAAVKRGDVVKTSDPRKIPAGVMVMWTGGSRDNGHAAYSLGKGEMVSTDLPHRGFIGRTRISQVKARWGLTLVGYIKRDANGYTYVRPDNDTRPVKEYEVVIKAGVNGRKKANTSSEIVRVAEHGDIVKAVKLTEGSGMTWAVTENGVHYALGRRGRVYLKRV